MHTYLVNLQKEQFLIYYINYCCFIILNVFKAIYIQKHIIWIPGILGTLECTHIPVDTP